MKKRYAVNPCDAKYYTTEEIRNHFLINDLFVNDGVMQNQIEGLKISGIVPVKKTLDIENDGEAIIINLGSLGSVEINENEIALDYLKGIATTERYISFKEFESGIIPKFLVISKKTKASYETKELNLTNPYVGSSLEASIENISNNKIDAFIPNGLAIYLYNTNVLHLFGEQNESRHIMIKENEIFISPSWSISGSFGNNEYKRICIKEINEQENIDIDEII